MASVYTPPMPKADEPLDVRPFQLDASRAAGVWDETASAETFLDLNSKRVEIQLSAASTAPAVFSIDTAEESYYRELNPGGSIEVSVPSKITNVAIDATRTNELVPEGDPSWRVWGTVWY